MPTAYTEPTEYAARLDDVLEITLRGVADPAFWQRHLAPLGLTVPPGEAASVRISGASGRFRGLAFREVSASVTVAPPEGAPTFPDHAYLLRATNSNRLFAFVERAIFSTPYEFARCAIEDAPAQVTVARDGVSLLTLAQDADADRARRAEAASWRGTVSLPPARAGASATHFFVAEIDGEATVSPFVPGQDRCYIDGSAEAPFALLAASGFQPREWTIRRAASHAKSKTYRRILPSPGS